MRKFTLIAVFLFINACKLPKLSITKKDILLGKIKTNGFYYSKPDYWSFILYQNGVFMGDFGVSEKNIESVERQFSKMVHSENIHKTSYAWGLFEVVGDSIRIEHWESREWAAYGITKYSGVILNDSSLLLNHPVVGLDTFHFHPLSVKPDSTNKFIK